MISPLFSNRERKTPFVKFNEFFACAAEMVHIDGFDDNDSLRSVANLDLSFDGQVSDTVVAPVQTQEPAKQSDTILLAKLKRVL